MNKYITYINLILYSFYMIVAAVTSGALLFIMISGWISYIFKIDVLGSDYHQLFGMVGNQLLTFQLFWIIWQTIFLILIFISTCLMNKKWWFYYIWAVLIIEFIVTNIEKLNLTDIFFWVPFIYTIIFYFVDQKVKKEKRKMEGIVQ